MIRFNRVNQQLSPGKSRVNPAVGFGTSFAAGMALFAFAGHALDVKTDREPLFTLIGIFMGLVYGGWELWKLITAENQRAEEERRQHSSKEEPRDE